MAEKKETYTVTGRKEEKITLTEGTERINIRVIYQTPDFPPRVIWIPKEDWSKEKEDKTIRAEIRSLKEFKPEIVRG